MCSRFKLFRDLPDNKDNSNFICIWVLHLNVNCVYFLLEKYVYLRMYCVFKSFNKMITTWQFWGLYSKNLLTESKLGLKAKYSDKILISALCLTLHSTVRRIIIQKTVKPKGNSQAYATFSSKGESYVGGMGPNVIAVEYFRAKNRKKHARTLRERGTPKVSKMAVILIFLFSTIYYATAEK